MRADGEAPTPDWHVTDLYDPEELADALDTLCTTPRYDLVACAALMIRRLDETLVNRMVELAQNRPTIHRHAEGGYVWTECPYCERVDVDVDEEGCCVTCGTDALRYGREPEEGADG